QVWDLVGDGAFSMVNQDLVTMVQHNLPSIHVVFSNMQFGFIKKAQENTNKHNFFGVDFFVPVDFAKIADAQGAVGYTIESIDEIDSVFEQAIADEKSGKVVVIDCKITGEQPIPVEDLIIDSEVFSKEEIDDFTNRYEACDLKPFRHYLEEEGLSSKGTTH